jgi:acyl carrier protein
MTLTKEQIFERLNAIFRDVFDDANITVNESTTAADIPEWDSLNHVTLIVSVEKEFGVKFNMSEVVGMHDVGEMAALIEKRAAK